MYVKVQNLQVLWQFLIHRCSFLAWFSFRGLYWVWLRTQTALLARPLWEEILLFSL